MAQILIQCLALVSQIPKIYTFGGLQGMVYTVAWLRVTKSATKTEKKGTLRVAARAILDMEMASQKPPVS